MKRTPCTVNRTVKTVTYIDNKPAIWELPVILTELHKNTLGHANNEYEQFIMVGINGCISIKWDIEKKQDALARTYIIKI